MDASANNMIVIEAKLFTKAGGADLVEFGFLPVAIAYQEVTKELGLLVLNEQNKEHIFFAFLPNNTYKRPRDARFQFNRDLTVCIYMRSANISKHTKDGNIIEWWQPTCRAGYLLLFKKEIGCSYIWGIIRRMQRDWNINNHGGGSFYSGISKVTELPPVDLSSLPLLLKIILGCKFSDQMRVAELITRDKYFFPKLVGLFKTCEDSENIDGLHMIYRLVRGIILLSNLSVYDQMFCDEFFMGVVGALGYDPEEPKAQKHHSLLENVVKEHVIFKEALPVSDCAVYTKLYQSIGADYIKDVILQKTLDEVTIASLTLLAHAKDAVAFSLLLVDTCFIQELLAKLKSDGTSPDSKRDLVLLLCELWSFCENADNVEISDFWWDIVDGETYNITVNVMQAIVIQKDERCLRRIVERNLLRLIIEIFYVSGYEDGIVHDGVLELLKYIAEENMEVLVIYLWETFSVELEKYDSFKSIQALKIKYKQCLEESEQETENNAKGTASNRGEDGGLNKLAAKDDFKMDSWTYHFHSFYRRFICTKKKVD